MLIKGNNGQSAARKRQPKSVSSSSKSVRSNHLQKSNSSRNDIQAAAKLDANSIHPPCGIVEGETSNPILEETRTAEGTRRIDLPNQPTELTAITLIQPWASLIANGHKQYETRDWPTSYRGSIAIHAGRKPKGKQELREHDKTVASFDDLLTEDCPYSSVIAIAQLTDCILMTEEFISQQNQTELRCGNWQVGRYAFKLENIQPIAPVQAAGKQGLWKWNSDSWNPDDFGELHHVAEANGQLNLLDWTDKEPPDPDDYVGSIELFNQAYKQWEDSQQSTVNSQEELCNTLMDGSTFVQELEPAFLMPESNSGSNNQINFVKEIVTAAISSSSDTPQMLESLQMSIISQEPEQQTSSQQVPPASHSATTESDSLPTTIETVSQQFLRQSENFSPDLQLSKTSPDSLTVPTLPVTNQEVTLDLSSTAYTRSGSMQNGKLSAAHTLEVPGVESEFLFLRSPGALSGGENSRPPGKSKLETQLNQLGLIQDGEVVAPEFLELGYSLPVGYTNLKENRTALELSQVQAQQLRNSIDPSLESQVETETTAIVEKPLAIAWTGESPLLDSNELNISVNLPPNIGALTKNELLSLAQEQHQIISLIERKQFELAVEKIHRVRLTGEYLIEFKKRCQYGEFIQTLESHNIGTRSAQEYMMVAKNWETIETKARAVALLPEENRPTLGIKWALEAIRENKKQEKKEAPPKDPDSWRTPNTSDQPIVSLVKQALGGQIWLDPASDEGGNIPAAVRYYKHDDGLAAHNTWSKTVFINPPFSDPFPWVERCCLETARGNVSAAVMLLKAGVVSNVRTGELINKYASAVCHWRGRINFLNDEGNPIKGSDFDCIFVYFGARLDLFREAFGGRGTIATIENHYSSVNKKYLLKSEIPEFGNTQAEQKQLAAAVGLGNGRSVLPDMRDADRERMERYDPHTIVDVMSVPTMSPTVPTIPAPPISENLVQPLGEPEIFDDTPLATRQFQKAKENCLNDYITAISSNLSEFSNDQIAFLAKIINEESAKRIDF